MKDLCFENNNNKSSIIDGDNIKDNFNNINKTKESSAQRLEISVFRQLPENNNKKKCKTIWNEHDIKHAMLQANQVNLKNSLIHGTAKNQLVNLNFFSTDGKLDQRKNLEKLSLQYVLSKGKLAYCVDYFFFKEINFYLICHYYDNIKERNYSLIAYFVCGIRKFINVFEGVFCFVFLEGKSVKRTQM